MKKLVIVLIALIVAVSLSGLAFAQEKAKPGNLEIAKPAEPAKPAEAAKPEAQKDQPKVVKYRAGGLVEALDVEARKITIKQDKVNKERVLKLIVSKKAAKDLAEIKVGDEVNVWVTGKVITALQKVS